MRLLPETLRGRLIWIIIGALLPIIAIDVWLARLEYLDARRNAEQTLTRHARNLSAQFDQAVLDAGRAALAVSQVALSQFDDKDECREQLLRFVPAFSRFMDFAAADVDGYVFCHSSHQVRPIHVDDRDYFRATMAHGTIEIGRLVVSRASGVAVIPVSAPIVDIRQRKRGVAIVSIDGAWLSHMLFQYRLPPGYSAMLIDPTGAIVARRPDGMVLTGSALAPGTLADALATRQTGIFPAADVDGVEKLFVAAASSEHGGASPYRIVVGVPANVIFNEAAKALTRDVMAALASNLLAALLIFALGYRFITRHIVAMHERVQEIGRGQFSHSTPRMEPEGQLGALASGIEKMATDVAALQAAREAESIARAEERAAMATAERESMFRKLLDAYESPAFAKDMDGRYLLVNKAFETLAARDRADIVGKSDGELFGTRQAAALVCNDREVTESGVTRVYDETLILDDGPRNYLSVKFPLRDASGRIYALACVATDVTERKRLAMQREMLLATLARRNRELQEFAYVASHDLQEPLRKISSFGERLINTQGEQLDARGRDYIARMQSAALRMSTLIKDLLTYSRLETRAEPIQEVNLDAVVALVLDDLDEAIAGCGASVEVAPLGTVQGDPTQLQQLFQNLIGNALKFRQEGKTPQIRVWSEPQTAATGQALVVHVADNGIGFDEKHVERIFAPFQRLHGRDEYPGTGIGLAICRKVMERHGGQMTAASQPGAGATFTAVFPNTPPPDTPSGPSSA